MQHNPLIDEQALAALHMDVWDWALFQCRYDRDRAADTLQVSYLKVVSGTARFQGRSALRTWLFGVVRLTALEQARLGARGAGPADRGPADRGLVNQGLAEEQAELVDPDASARVMQVNAALSKLSFSQREVVYLVFYRDLSLAEAARVLGMQLGTVRTHYDRAKRRLRQQLAVEKDVGDAGAQTEDFLMG